VSLLLVTAAPILPRATAAGFFAVFLAMPTILTTMPGDEQAKSEPACGKIRGGELDFPRWNAGKHARLLSRYALVENSACGKIRQVYQFVIPVTLLRG
jgi:hypothetical protein